MSPKMTHLLLDIARVGVQAVTHLVLGPVVDMVQGEEQVEVAPAVVLVAQEAIQCCGGGTESNLNTNFNGQEGSSNSLKVDVSRLNGNITKKWSQAVQLILLKNGYWT
jgi:hypothetical protein